MAKNKSKKSKKNKKNADRVNVVLGRDTFVNDFSDIYGMTDDQREVLRAGIVRDFPEVLGLSDSRRRLTTEERSRIDPAHPDYLDTRDPVRVVRAIDSCNEDDDDDNDDGECDTTVMISQSFKRVNIYLGSTEEEDAEYFRTSAPESPAFVMEKTLNEYIEDSVRDRYKGDNFDDIYEKVRVTLGYDTDFRYRFAKDTILTELDRKTFINTVEIATDTVVYLLGDEDSFASIIINAVINHVYHRIGRVLSVELANNIAAVVTGKDEEAFKVKVSDDKDKEGLIKGINITMDKEYPTFKEINGLIYKAIATLDGNWPLAMKDPKTFTGEFEESRKFLKTKVITSNMECVERSKRKDKDKDDNVVDVEVTDVDNEVTTPVVESNEVVNEAVNEVPPISSMCTDRRGVRAVMFRIDSEDDAYNDLVQDLNIEVNLTDAGELQDLRNLNLQLEEIVDFIDKYPEEDKKKLIESDDIKEFYGYTTRLYNIMTTVKNPDDKSKANKLKVLNEYVDIATDLVRFVTNRCPEYNEGTIEELTGVIEEGNKLIKELEKSNLEITPVIPYVEIDNIDPINTSEDIITELTKIRENTTSLPVLDFKSVQEVSVILQDTLLIYNLFVNNKCDNMDKIDDIKKCVVVQMDEDDFECTKYDILKGVKSTVENVNKRIATSNDIKTRRSDILNSIFGK